MVIPRSIPWYGCTMVYHMVIPWYDHVVLPRGHTMVFTSVLVYHGVPWYTMLLVYHGIPWYTMVHQTPWYTNTTWYDRVITSRPYHGIPYHGLGKPWYTMVRQPCRNTSRSYNGLPWYTSVARYQGPRYYRSTAVQFFYSTSTIGFMVLFSTTIPQLPRFVGTVLSDADTHYYFSAFLNITNMCCVTVFLCFIFYFYTLGLAIWTLLSDTNKDWLIDWLNNSQ